MLQTHAPVISSVIVFILIRFDSFLNNMYPEKAKRISVDGRPKRSEMYALSNETHLCGQGQKVINISLFQGPRYNVQISWKLIQKTRGN